MSTAEAMAAELVAGRTAEEAAPGPAPSGAPPGPRADEAALDLEWSRLKEAIRRRIKPEQFETWFRRAALRSIGETEVCLVVQNSFARDWLCNHYLHALEQAATAVFGSPRRIEVSVDPELALPPRRDASAEPAPCEDPERGSRGRPALQPGAAPETSCSSGGAAIGASNGPQRGLQQGPQHPQPIGQPGVVYLDSVRGPRGLLWSSDFALNPSYRFESFVVGPCNRFAHAASVGVSESPGKAYNPFFLHGGVGLGKTHLLQSLCAALLERQPRTRILYLSCETFINHFISALENGDVAAFRNKYRNVDVILVDDIHMLANKERTQEEFFNTFNTLYNAGKQIVLSSDTSPKEIPALQERLVSRFKWGLVTEIEKPCFETRVAILRRKSRERGREISEGVAQLIAEHVDSNIRELEGAATRVIGFASLSGQEISVELVRKVLADVFVSRKGQPTMEDVLKIVTTHFSVRVTDLQSRKRTNAIAHPRQIGMYLARRITRHSLEEIGGFFGGRDHSTVLYALEKVEAEMKRDERFRGLIASFLDQLQRSSG